MTNVQELKRRGLSYHKKRLSKKLFKVQELGKIQPNSHKEKDMVWEGAFPLRFLKSAPRQRPVSRPWRRCPAASCSTSDVTPCQMGASSFGEPLETTRKTVAPVFTVFHLPNGSPTCTFCSDCSLDPKVHTFPDCAVRSYRLTQSSPL